MQAVRKPTTIALISILAALGLAVQLAPRPPNVEFTSLLTFVVGFVFGSFTGILFGSFVMFFNGFFSPWGFAGLNMPFQMVGISVVGLAGGLYQRHMQSRSTGKFCVEVSVIGAFFTVLYDLVTNFGVALSFIIVGMHPTLAITTAIAYGAPFSLIHVGSNIAVFGIAFLPLVKALNYTSMVRNFG
jgi:uncharacterized membrane protein